MTLIPLKLYFNERGRAKLKLAVAKGKKLHDKRESEKKRDWSREKGRLKRARGKHDHTEKPARGRLEQDSGADG
jgi:SsrA-binding protein